MFLALTLFSNVVNFLDVCHSMDPEQNLLLPNTTCNCLELHKCDWLAVTTIKIDSSSIGQRENYIWKHQLRFYSVARDGTRISAAPRQSWLQLSLQLSAPWSPDSASSMLWAVKLGQNFEGYTVYDIP